MWRHVLSSRRIIFGAAVLGLIARLAFDFGYWNNRILTGDEREYLALGRSIASGDGFAYHDQILGQPFSRAPGYPTFLAVVVGRAPMANATPGSVKAVQACLGAVGVIFTGLLAARLAGPAAGGAAALIAAFYPPLVWISGYALTEGVYWPLSMLTLWLFEFARDATARRALQRFFVCGIAIGACILLRPSMIFFVLFAAPWLVWHSRRLAPAALLVGAAALMVLPWTARNYVVHHRLVVVAAEGGVTFWLGNHPLARGEGDLSVNPEIARANTVLRTQYLSLSEEEMEPIYYREALAWIRRHPIDWLRLEARKAFYTVVPLGPSYTAHSSYYFSRRWPRICRYCLLRSSASSGSRGAERCPASGACWRRRCSSVFCSFRRSDSEFPASTQSL